MITRLLHFIIALLIVVALAYYIKGERGGASFSQIKILPPSIVQPASCWIRPESDFLLVGIWGRKGLAIKTGA